MNPIKSARITIQKNLARNNSGRRNTNPNPIMEILSFSLMTTKRYIVIFHIRHIALLVAGEVKDFSKVFIF